MLLHEVDLPAPLGSQALIRAEYSNVSVGTEMAYVEQARRLGRPAPPLGYSLVGVVESVGPDAAVSVGDRVLSLSPHGSAVIAEAAPGWLTIVPDDLNPASATLGTMAGIAMHIVQKARVRTGDRCAVFGMGVLGMLVVQLLKRDGVGFVAAVEPSEPRRKIAERLGADISVDPGADDSWVSALNASLSIETAGHPSVFPAALDVLATGGRLVCTSTFLDPLPVTLYPMIVEKELTLIGAHQPKCPLLPVPDYPYSQSENRALALRMIADGTLEVGDLITDAVPWRESEAFYSRLESGKTLGAIINWSE